MKMIFLYTSEILKYVFKVPDQCTHIDEVHPKILFVDYCLHAGINSSPAGVRSFPSGRRVKS